MKVYVVIDLESKEVKGVFATSVRAHGYCYRHNRKCVPREFKVEEHELKGL